MAVQAGKIVSLVNGSARTDDEDVLYVVDYPVEYQAPTKKDVTTTSGDILAANPDRKCAVIVNDSDAVIYLAVGSDAVLNSGIRLNPQAGSAQFGGPGGLPLTTQAIKGIHGGTGNKNVTVQEAT